MLTEPQVVLTDPLFVQSKIAEDPMTHGSMLCPVIAGADKTTVSVATGHTEYHPVYTSCGNTSNEMRRAHRNGVVPIAFLAIPKGIYVFFLQWIPIG